MYYMLYYMILYYILYTYIHNHMVHMVCQANFARGVNLRRRQESSSQAHECDLCGPRTERQWNPRDQTHTQHAVPTRTNAKAN